MIMVLKMKYIYFLPTRTSGLTPSAIWKTVVEHRRVILEVLIYFRVSNRLD